MSSIKMEIPQMPNQRVYTLGGGECIRKLHKVLSAGSQEEEPSTHPRLSLLSPQQVGVEVLSSLLGR